MTPLHYHYAVIAVDGGHLALRPKVSPGVRSHAEACEQVARVLRATVTPFRLPGLLRDVRAGREVNVTRNRTMYRLAIVPCRDVTVATRADIDWSVLRQADNGVRCSHNIYAWLRQAPRDPEWNVTVPILGDFYWRPEHIPPARVSR